MQRSGFMVGLRVYKEVDWAGRTFSWCLGSFYRILGDLFVGMLWLDWVNEMVSSSICKFYVSPFLSSFTMLSISFHLYLHAFMLIFFFLNKHYCL